MHQFQISGYQIYLSNSVLEIFDKYTQTNKDSHEAGGILLGQTSGKSIYILKATIPTKFDKSTRYSFIRSKEIAQIIVDYEFINSNRKTIYLGEWHTHPEKIPSPSGQDIKMIKEQRKLSKLNEDFILLFIKGIEKLYAGVYIDKDLKSLLL